MTPARQIHKNSRFNLLYWLLYCITILLELNWQKIIAWIQCFFNTTNKHLQKISTLNVVFNQFQRGNQKDSSSLWTYFVTQCAAVSTHCVPIKAAPQRYWLREFIRATCQHHSAWSPSSPPTTRPLLEVPLTPHTYLLYTGCLEEFDIGLMDSKVAENQVEILELLNYKWWDCRMYDMYVKFGKIFNKVSWNIKY